MSKTIIVGGFGPGISTGVAEKFGAEGFTLALVGRNREKLEAGAVALTKKGIKAHAFPADLGDDTQARSVVRTVRESLGPISVLQWTAYGGAAGDLLAADAAAIRGSFDTAIVGLLGAIQEALPDLRANKGAILVTNGGLGFFDTAVDAMAVQWGAMGLAMANSAKHKLVRMLAEKLRPEGVYVGEVMVMGAVKGTPFDNGQGPTLDPRAIGEKFWEIYSARKEVSVNFA